MSEPTTTESNAPDPTPTPAAPEPTAEAAPGSVAAPGPDDGAYGLANPSPATSPPPPPNTGGDWSVDQPAASTFEAKAVEGEDESSAADFPADAPIVEHVWTRWAEWKEPAIWSAGGAVAAALILFAGEWISVLIFLVAMAYGAYHFIISLEVPVRVTPEQVVREFYGSLNHRMPNYARMYSLLTADGRNSNEFSDFSRFRSYWHSQLARLARSPVWMVPLEFGFDSFKCRYDADRTLAAVRFTLRVTPRGSQAASDPIAEFDMNNLTVKGPDGQWYLNDGLLPNPTEHNDD